MFQSDMLSLIAQVLLIAGALNWGSIAFANTDFVQMLVGNFDVYVKMLVAAAGLYAVYDMYVKYTAAPADEAAAEKTA